MKSHEPMHKKPTTHVTIHHDIDTLTAKYDKVNSSTIKPFKACKDATWSSKHIMSLSSHENQCTQSDGHQNLTWDTIL